MLFQAGTFPIDVFSNKDSPPDEGPIPGRRDVRKAMNSLGFGGPETFPNYAFSNGESTPDDSQASFFVKDYF